MKTWRSILKRAAQRLDLPTDIAAGLPAIRLCGFSECSMDCHRAILAYEPDEIVIRLNIGTVTVRGSGLEVCRMHRDQLCIRGAISDLHFDEG